MTTFIIARTPEEAQWARSRFASRYDSVTFLTGEPPRAVHGRYMDDKDLVIFVNGWQEGDHGAEVMDIIAPMMFGRDGVTISSRNVSMPPSFPDASLVVSKTFPYFGSSTVVHRVVLSKCPKCKCLVAPGDEDEHYLFAHP